MRIRRQSGVALISVLLVFALVAVIASQMLANNYLSIRKTANRMDSRQAYYYALAGEQLARQILARDYRSGNGTSEEQVDRLTDDWAQTLDVFDIDEGKMEVEIVDAHSLFNINTLVDDEGQPVPEAKEQFKRLLTVLELPVDIADSLMDWQDADSQPLTAGAEDAYYQFLERPYLSANQRVADRSELRLLKGINYNDYNTLKPFVVALPEISTYNVNTAKSELLRALSDQLNESAAESLQTTQQDGGYDSLSGWLSDSQGVALSLVKGQLGVKSEYFEVRVISLFNNRSSRMRTLLHRDAEDGKITVIKRQADQLIRFRDKQEL